MRFYYYRDHRSERFNTSPGHAWAGEMTSGEMAARVRADEAASSYCDFCSTIKMTPWFNEESREEEHTSHVLKVCKNCGWWNTLTKSQLNYIPGFDSDFHFQSYCSGIVEHFAILDSFDISENTAPLEEVSAVLVHDWRYARNISAQTAQDLVMQVFKSHLNCEVHYYDDAVYAPDGGIDFVLVRSDRSRIAFQVKRRQADRTESVRPVREFIGALAESPYREGMFVTTTRLSDYAKKEISRADQQLRLRGLEVTVVDGERLRDLLSLNKPSNRSVSALTQIVPASGWVSHSLKINGAEIGDVLEHVRRRRASNH